MACVLRHNALGRQEEQGEEGGAEGYQPSREAVLVVDGALRLRIPLHLRVVSSRASCWGSIFHSQY